MIMPENKIIDSISRRKSLGKLIQRLFFPFEHILHVTRKPVAARPAVAESERDPRMQHTEKELRNTVVEKSAQETIAERYRTKAVTMPQTEAPASYLDHSRLDELLHAKLLEVAVCPHIVVSLKEIHLHTPVHQILKSGKDTDVALRDDIAVLVPEVPYVSKKIQSLGILRQ